MAFIEKKDPIVLNIKLTSKGRELLAAGNLNFKYFAIGDSEIDYEFNDAANAIDPEYSAFNSSILRPVDKSPEIISFIPRDLSGDSYNELSTIPVSAYSVENKVESLGFFTNSGTSFITDTNHVKQPDVMIEVSGVTGGTNLTLLKAPTYGTSGEEPEVGDYLFVRWTTNNNTTGFTVNKTYPTPNLFYQITAINGVLGNGSVDVTVDRELPNFSGISFSAITYAGAMIFYSELTYSGATAFNLSPTDYVDEAVLTFLSNSQCPTVVFPYWNVSVIFTEEIAGVLSGNLKYNQFKNKKLGGFVSYIQNQSPVLKKLGVIHYSNSSPANVYAEGFLLKTLVLEMPTIMWHKSNAMNLGATFIPYGSSKLLTGTTKSLNTTYYDLVDKNNTSVVVGKVFNELKIIVIEDQELLFAMSYKSNRSWTLPNYNANTNTIVTSYITSSGGTNVTWKFPTDNSQHTCIVPYTGASSGVEYCHSNLGWTELTDTLSLGNICNAGYRVTICTSNPTVGGGVSICARDYVNNVNISTIGNGGGGGAIFTATLNNINNNTGFLFTGNLT